MIQEEVIVTSAERTSQFTGALTTLFKGKKLHRQFNYFESPVDYLGLYLDDVWALTQPVGFVYTKEDAYLNVMSVDEYTLVIGPCYESQPTESQIDKLASKMDLSPERKTDFFQKILDMNYMPIRTAVLMACADYHVLTGIKLNPSDIFKNESRKLNALSYASERQWKSFCELDESMILQETMYQFERKFCNAVMTGREDAVDRVLEDFPTELPRRGPTAARNTNNSFIIATTLVSRCVIKCGVSPAESLALADYYIDRCERSKTPDDLRLIMSIMLKRFAGLVRKESKEAVTSEFINNINNYIEQHMNERITVDEMAYDMGMSRNTLSGRFKKEAGCTLLEYITQKKVNRAMYILTSTDYSLSEISAYLAFSSQSHFQRIFKQYTNMTPNEYRKNSMK